MRKFFQRLSTALTFVFVGTVFAACGTVASAETNGERWTVKVPEASVSEQNRQPNDAKRYVIREGKKYELLNDNRVQLVADQHFYTGINVLGLDPGIDGRAVRGRLTYNDEALPSDDIDPWEYTQWYTNPGIHTEHSHTVVGDEDWYTNSSKTVRVNRKQKSIYLQIDSKDVEVQAYWPHALIEKTFSYTPRFGELTSLTASMRFCLEDFLDYNGYNGGQTAQMSWWFFITDRQDKWVDDGRDCFFGIPLFDCRQDIYGNAPGEVAESFGWESQTKDALFKVARSSVSISPAIENNQLSGSVWYTMTADILPLFDYGLGRLMNYSNSDATIQAEVRQKFAGGTLDNFFITGFNIGWEMPYGRYKAGFNFADISLVATYK